MHLSARSRLLHGVLLACIAGTAVGGARAQTTRDLSLSAGPMYEAWSEGDSALACCLVLEAPVEADERRRPVQVALALDVSREAAGAPLTAIKETAKLVVNSLGDGDQLAIVTFSDFARCVFSMQQLNSASRKTAAAAVEALREETGRNMAAGLEKARAELTRLKNPGIAGRYLLVLAIGDATKGTRKPKELLAIASALHEEHEIGVSVFGISTFGTYGAKVDFDEELFENMALRNGGRYYFVEELEEAGTLVGHEAERIAKASARRVAVEVDTRSSAAVSNVAGAIQENGRLVVGDMRPGQRRLVVFDLVNRPERERDIVLTATYIEPGGFSERRFRSYMRIPLTSGSRRLDNKLGPYLAVFDLQEDLARTADRMKENRRDYLTMYRSRLTELEQENTNLGSDYVAEQLEYYRDFERDLDDTAIEAERLIKHTKFRLLKILYGLEKH